MFELREDGTFIRTISREEEMEIINYRRGYRIGLIADAIVMLKDKVPIKYICMITDLPEDEIKELRKEIKVFPLKKKWLILKGYESDLKITSKDTGLSKENHDRSLSETIRFLLKNITFDYFSSVIGLSEERVEELIEEEES